MKHQHLIFEWGGAGTTPVPQNSSLLYITAAVAVVGGIVSAVGTYQQGQAAKATAEANADLAERQARQQLMVDRIRENVAAQQAEMDRRLAISEAQAATQNSIAAKNEAEAQAALSRENIKRARDVAARKQASISASHIAGGTVDTTGTPLAVLAEQVFNSELDAQDQMYVANVERTKKLFESDLLALSGKNKEYAAKTQFAIAKEASKVRSIASRIEYRKRIDQAGIDRWAGAQAAKNATTSAIGQGIGSVGSALAKF